MSQMITKIEVQIGDGRQKPKVFQQADGTWAVEANTSQCADWSRGVWVRTYDPDGGIPKDGKGFKIGLTRRLKAG